MEALLRWYYTVRPLKRAQWWNLLTRPIRMKLSRRRDVSRQDVAAALSWPDARLYPLHVASRFEPEKRRFIFLNKSKSFKSFIHWNYEGHGLLWTFNLNYFEWLYDDTLSIEERTKTIREYVAYHEPNPVAENAYTISLRIVAWTRFLLRADVKEEDIFRRLYSDADWLFRFPEYHLQGNHLWENAIAMLCAGAFFRSDRLLQRGRKLTRACIAEQVLADGGHAEGSPMYHSLLLWRLMQCIELLEILSEKEEALTALLRVTASRMLGWLESMTFGDGTWPQFNDCTQGIAPDTAELLRYAALLSIAPNPAGLGDSGYRLIRSGPFELAIDVSPIRPAFQPGHSHADVGTFCLHYNRKPIIVDSGTSTYEPGRRRLKERGTAAHNTIVIGGRNTSEVWKSFRVGRRARILDIRESSNSLAIRYKPYSGSAEVLRTFSWDEGIVTITDELRGEQHPAAEARLHFHPKAEAVSQGIQNITIDGLIFNWKGSSDILIIPYSFASGFNLSELAQCLVSPFRRRLKLTITAQSD